MTPTNGSGGARPRPQFGQYASAEEQKASIKDPEEYFEQLSQSFAPQTEPSTQQPATDARDSGSSEMPTQRTTPASRVGPKTGSASNAGSGSTTSSHVEHPADRIATFVLLAIGLFMSVTMVPAMLHPADGIQVSYDQFDIGTYSATGLTQVVGIGIAFVYIVGWLFAAFKSMSRLRSGQYAWWVPALVGAVVWILSMIGYAILMLSDPTFMNYATSLS